MDRNLKKNIELEKEQNFLTNEKTNFIQEESKVLLNKEIEDLVLDEQRVYITQLNFNALRELQDIYDQETTWHIEIPHWEHSVEYVTGDNEDNQEWIDDTIWPDSIYDTLQNSLGLTDFETSNSFIPFYNDFELMILADEFYSVGQIKMFNTLHIYDDEHKVDFYQPYYEDFNIQRKSLAKKAITDPQLLEALGPISPVYEKPSNNQFNKDWSNLISHPCQDVDVENWFGPLIVSPDYFSSWFQPTSAAPALFMQRDDIAMDTFTDLALYLSVSSILIFFCFLFYRLHGLIFWILDSIDQEDLLNLRVISGKDYQLEMTNLKNMIVSVEIFFFYIGIFFFILSLFYVPITIPFKFRRKPFDFDTTKLTQTAKSVPMNLDFDFWSVSKAFNTPRRYAQYKQYVYRSKHNYIPWDVDAFTLFREDNVDDPNFFVYRQGFEDNHRVRKKYETAYDTLFNEFALDPVATRSVLFNTLFKIETRAINMSGYMLMRDPMPKWYEKVFWPRIFLGAHTYEWAQLYNKDVNAFTRIKYFKRNGLRYIRFLPPYSTTRKTTQQNLIVQETRTNPPEQYNTFEMSSYRELSDPQEYEDGFFEGNLRPGTLLNENVTKSSSFTMLKDIIIIWIKQFLLDFGFYKKSKEKQNLISLEKKIDVSKQNAVYTSLLFEDFVKVEKEKLRPAKQLSKYSKLFGNYNKRVSDYFDYLGQGNYEDYVDRDIMVQVKRQVEAMIRKYKWVFDKRDARKHHSGFGTAFGLDHEISPKLDFSNLRIPFVKVNKVTYDLFMNSYGDLPVTDYFTHEPLMHMRKKNTPFDKEINALFSERHIMKPQPKRPYYPFFFEYLIDYLGPSEVDILYDEDFLYWFKEQVNQNTFWSIPYYATPSAVTTTTPRIWKEYTPWSFITDVYFVTKFPRPFELALHHRKSDEAYWFKPLNFSFEYSPSINPDRRFKYKPSYFDPFGWSNSKNLAVHKTIEAEQYANDPKKFIAFLEFLKEHYNLPPQPTVIKTRVPERQFFVPQLLSRLGFYDSRFFIVPMQLYEQHRRHIIALLFFSIFFALITGRDTQPMDRQQYEAIKAQHFAKAWNDRSLYRKTRRKLWAPYDKINEYKMKLQEKEAAIQERKKNSSVLASLDLKKEFPYIIRMNHIIKTENKEYILKKRIFKKGRKLFSEKKARYLGILNATISMTERRFIMELIQEYQLNNEPIPKRLLNIQKKLFKIKL